MSLFKKALQCPKCDRKNIKVVKPSFYTKFQDSLNVFRKKTKNLNVCKDCGFSWEDR